MKVDEVNESQDITPNYLDTTFGAKLSQLYGTNFINLPLHLKVTS